MMKINDASLSVANTLEQEESDWELKIDSHRKFVRLTPANRDFFFSLLGNESDLDSYAASPVYYALTGRRGLWLFQDGGSYVPLCWHPNVKGQILVFSPRGEKNPDVMTQLLAEMPIPPASIRLARIKKSDADQSWLAGIVGSSVRSVSLVSVEETVLDWRYPVRILSTERVSQMRGGDYYHIRSCVARAKQYEITFERLNPNHSNQIMNFAYQWANRRTNNVDELMNLVSPYQQTLNLLGDKSFNLDGLVFFIDGQVQAVTIWEPPNTDTNIANAWVNLSNTAYKGISEYVMKALAETLHAQGVPLINFGGSETQGLDDYKNKYRPAHSVELRSIEVVVDENDFVFQNISKIRKARVAA